MRISVTKEILIEVIIILFIVLWLYTGLNKILDYKSFKTQLEKSPFVERFATLISWTLPTTEMLIAATLVYKRTKLLGLYLSYTLMLLFTGYIWLMLRYAYDLPCSCGGILASMSWQEHLIFNTTMTLLVVLAIVAQTQILIKRKEDL